MAIKRAVLFPETELTEKQKTQIILAEVALDAILQINHSAFSVLLGCCRDQRIRTELEDIYTSAGWHVRFVQSGSTENYFMDITP